MCNCKSANYTERLRVVNYTAEKAQYLQTFQETIHQYIAQNMGLSMIAQSLLTQ